MTEILALALKDLRMLMRDRTGFFFTLMWPLIIAVFFGTLFGGGGGDGPRGLPILIVDEDGTSGSQQFISKLDAAPELAITITSREEAVSTVRRGRAAAYVALKPGFGQASESVFWGGAPQVELGVDPARHAEASMVEGILMKYGAERMEDVFSNSDAQVDDVRRARESMESSTDVPADFRSNLVQLFDDLDRFFGDESFETADTADGEGAGLGGFTPLDIERADITVIGRKGPTNAYAISFPQGVIWGIIGSTAGFAISLVIERTRGTLLRLQTAPISRTQILAGKAGACFVSATSISVGLFIFGFFVFKLHPGSFPLLVLAVVSSAVCFVGIMMLLAVMGRTEHAAGGIGWAVLIVMSMLGGGMIPLFVMPGWMRTVSHVSPVKWSILAMEGAVWREFSLVEMLQPCGILLAVGIACFLIGVKAFGWGSQPQ
jgi:ABC-2 type transport system permease protein